MALGLSVALPYRGQSLLNPSTLFAGGEQGGWYDPSDLSTLFQDSAGTTRVTALGQAVGRINDKSGRGNHLTQTSATSRPLLQQDASGAFHLQFDGFDDFLTAGTFNMSASDKVTVCAGVRKNTDSIDQACAVELGADTATSAGFALLASNALTARWRLQLFGTSRAVRDTNPIFPAPDAAVITGLFDIAGATVAEEIIGRRNGVPVFIENTLSPAGTGNLPSAALFVGRRGGTTQPFNGNLYGLVIRGTAATTTQIAALERYMARQTGIAL